MIKDLYNKLGGISLDKTFYYEQMKEKGGDEWKAFLAFCDSVATNKYFDVLLEKLKAEQMKKAYDEAESFDQFNFGRCISIAYDLLYDEFKNNSVKYQSLIKGGKNG